MQTPIRVPLAQLCPDALGCLQQSCGDRGFTCNPRHLQPGTLLWVRGTADEGAPTSRAQSCSSAPETQHVEGKMPVTVVLGQSAPSSPLAVCPRLL